MDSIIQQTGIEPVPYRNRSSSIVELAAALVKAQAAMEGAKKENKAIVTGTTARTYADLASVWEAVRKPLTDNGLGIVQWPRTAGNGVEIETTLLHTSGQFMSDVLWVPANKMDAQGLGSAITYGRRYALMAVTGIAPVDDDGEDAVKGLGSASSGGEFRPAGRRPLPPAVQRQDRAAQTAEAQRDGLTANPKKETAPPASGANATKRAMWCQDAMDGFKLAPSKDALNDWWKSNTERLQIVEESMPMLYEKLLIAYDAAIEAAAVKVAA